MQFTNIKFSVVTVLLEATWSLAFTGIYHGSVHHFLLDLGLYIDSVYFLQGLYAYIYIYIYIYRLNPLPYIHVGLGLYSDSIAGWMRHLVPGVALLVFVFRNRRLFPSCFHDFHRSQCLSGCFAVFRVSWFLLDLKRDLKSGSQPRCRFFFQCTLMYHEPVRVCRHMHVWYSHSFIHSGYFSSISSRPLLLKCAPDYSIDTRRSATGNYEWRICPRFLRAG